MAIAVFYVCSLTFLFAALFATLAKGCLNRYFLQVRVPAWDHDADRRRMFITLTHPRFAVTFLYTSHTFILLAILWLILVFCQRLWVTTHIGVYCLLFSTIPGLVCYIQTLISLGRRGL